jgi:hypothetical protein
LASVNTGLLPPRLLEVLAAVADRDFAAKLEKVLVAAANASERLGDLNVLSYEAPTDEDSPNLSLWEEMAPVVGDTLIEVNKLLSEIRDVFGSGEKSNARDRSEVSAVATLWQACRELADEIARFGAAMRNPSIVSDRWTLLTEVQAFRTRFRTRIGKMVHEAAGAFEEVDAADVVPGLQDEIKAAVQLRTAITDLARVVTHRRRKLREAAGAEVNAVFLQLRKELDAFGRTAAYRTLRAQDKRQVIEFRHGLSKLEQQNEALRQKVLELLEPFLGFVGTLTRVNERKILIDHDRELRTSLGLKIEQIDSAIDRDLAKATVLFQEATEEIRDLYGRDPALDQFIRALRKRPNEQFDSFELRQGIEAFRELLAKLSIE